eukprot:scaffold298650_cov19-Prasinocladus_malaysianus.AAC.2
MLLAGSSWNVVVVVVVVAAAAAAAAAVVVVAVVVAAGHSSVYKVLLKLCIWGFFMSLSLLRRYNLELLPGSEQSSSQRPCCRT